MLSPQDAEKLAEGLKEIFENLEIDILDKIARRLEAGLSSQDWQQRKLSEVRILREEIVQLIAQYFAGFDDNIKTILEDAFKLGVNSADDDYTSVGKDIPEGVSATTINTMAITALVSESTGATDLVKARMLGSSQNIYRSVITEAASKVIAGLDTRQQAVKGALNRFAANGVTGFTDKAGKNWSASSYADMAIRTAVGRAAMAGHESRIKQLGEDLVIVSEHPDECGICRPWEGKILSISGTSTQYKSLQQAKNAGLFHPNCGHVATMYIPGYTSPVAKKIGNPDGYERKQRLNEINRTIKKWERRKAIAVTDQDKRLANAKIKEWRQIRRDHSN